VIEFLRNLFGVQGEYPAPKPKAVNAVMDEGDVHSGPAGYSPNTAYPETQYGSRFDEDEEWNEEH
jgi:hypothetical protein